MDLEDDGWVNIPYDGLPEVLDDGGKKFFSRKHVVSPKNLIKMEYFNSSQKSQEFANSSLEVDSRSPTQAITLPIEMEDHQNVDHSEEEVENITKLPLLVDGELKEDPEEDFDPIYQVLFKKENEFVEMKMNSPRSCSQKITLPRIEADMFQYEDKTGNHMFNVSSPSKVMIDEVENMNAIKEEGNEDSNMRKRGLNGLGVFCSLGMVAATICIILFGNGQRHKQQKLRIQIYSDNKRIRQVVHNANEAMSTVRGVPLTTAHITYGGYYEGF